MHVIKWRSISRRLQTIQNVGFDSSALVGRGFGCAHSSCRPVWYTGSQVHGRLDASSGRAFRCVTVSTPCLMSGGEKKVLLCVSRNHTECQTGISGSSASSGVVSGAAFLRSENALQDVPRKGYVFHGMGPSGSQGRKRPSSWMRAFWSRLPCVVSIGWVLLVVHVWRGQMVWHAAIGETCGAGAGGCPQGWAALPT